METRRQLRVTRVLTVLLIALVAAGSLIVWTPAARAEEPVRQVDITLSRISPSLPQRDGTITLKGRVTNITEEPLVQPRLYFWRNQAPITTREDLDRALVSESNDPLGQRLPTSLQPLTDDQKPALEPGESVAFTIKVAVADLALPTTDGVYLMGVHVLLPTSNLAIGRSRIFVPIVADDSAAALRITSVVVLNSRPSQIAKGLLSDDHLAKEVADGGRLEALLEAADTAGTSFAIDPELIETLQTMKAGYEVRQANGNSVTGTGQAAAAEWLEDYAELAADHDGFRLPYGSPDLAALTHDGQRAAIKSSTAAGKAVQSTASLPLLAFPAAGAADADTVNTAAALNPKAILLAETSANGDAPLLTGPAVRGADDPPIVSFSVGDAEGAVAGGGPGPDPRNSAPQIQQRVLAETWIEATTADGDSVRGRVRVITTAAEAKGDETATDAPWLRPTTLSELLDTVPKTWSKKFRYPNSARAAELTYGQLDRLKRLTTSYDTYAEMLSDASLVRPTADAAIARAASSGWRRHDRDRQAFLDPQQSRLDETVLNKIKIGSSPRVQTIGREVAFPITVTNDLEADPDDPERNAVNLRLEFTSDNSQRLSIKPIDISDLKAEDNSDKTIQVVAKANGTVPVVAQLRTESGLPVGRPVTIDVEVTQNGTVGWAIAVGSGIVLVGSTALRIRQVSKARSKENAGTESALTSGPPVDDAAHDGDGSSDSSVAGVRDV